jgi:cellobiose phosphorylase
VQPLPLHWPTWIARTAHPPAGESPLRAELFSIEQLERQAEILVASHEVITRKGSNQLLARLAQNEEVLRSFNRATLRVTQSRNVTPAAEWLLDNFYLIEEQVQMARRHLPKDYSRELPRLVAGRSAGLPRVYDLVLELITHLDAQLDAASLRAFVAAYQKVSPLKLGELWAIPIMLQLGLIENLRRITSRLVIARQDRDLADAWAMRLQAIAEKNPSELIVGVADMAKSRLSYSNSFVAEFCQRLARQGPMLHLARSWLEQRLGEQGLAIEQLVQADNQGQAVDQVSVSHSITSLRFLSGMDAKDFVEGLSLVEHTLRHDPAGVYPTMDFATRDHYRHAVEEFTRHSALGELAVAQKAIALAESAAGHKGRTDRTAHVGHYLIGAGRPALERATDVRWPARTLVERTIRQWPLLYFAGGTGAITVLATWGFGQEAHSFGVHGWRLGLGTALFAVAASQLAVSLMNWLSTTLVKPRLLPRLDFTAGIAADCRTVVVVPTMLTSPAGVDRLVENLEIHHLANRDAQLFFALLTDFRDAPQAVMPEDEALLQRARAGIRRLNARYSPGGPGPFYLFHRPRRWNPGEGVWMGYERKRGKLAEFNAFLREGTRESFAEIVGELSALSGVKYVITLDTDTQLPRDGARLLVATMAHPLNRPAFDPVRGIVTEGYGILQPRVSVSLPSAARSWFVRIFASDAGIDPYTRAVSDVYQDVFEEGSFIGKGIYDVEAFERALGGRLAENTILSHDLLEACHARSGLVSDVEFYEDHPSRYNVDINRRHRWIRGDWQIVQWLRSRVTRADGQGESNPLSRLSQWKIFDNLRRSLVPPALLGLLLAGWLLLPEIGGLVLLQVLGILAVPAFLPLAVEVGRKPREVPWAMHLHGTVATAGRQLAQIFLTLAFLPYDAGMSLDAIGRTLVRMAITHRRRLEWQTSSDTEQAVRSDLAGFFAMMWLVPLLALIVGAALVTIRPGQIYVAGPVLALWFVAPWIGWWISRTIPPPDTGLAEEQVVFLRHIARKTWHFFETFVTATENWLPPDNFQEIPSPVIASRTSPTNLGLALLANLGAQDLGYLTTGRLLRRTENTFGTMQRMERYRGHFYNWYDTRTLRPLPPLYVSSVDSGNLAGHLLVLSAGLRELPGRKIFSTRAFTGLRDTLEILRGLTGKDTALDALDTAWKTPPATVSAALTLLESTAAQAALFAGTLADGTDEARKWGQILQRSCEEHLNELQLLARWVRLAAGTGPGPLATELARLDREGPTLQEVADFERTLCPQIDVALAAQPATDTEEKTALTELLRTARYASGQARQRIAAAETLATQSDKFADMDFAFLSDPARELFAIGFNVTDHRRDSVFFDLLATEARLGVYVAIAQGQVSQEHWFAMSRLLVTSHAGPILVSWSGSMFEYLMPELVMPEYAGTLLDHTCKSAVERQIEYGHTRGVPWGISESGYNRTDVQMNYQYRAFGVPGLGLKRGLGDDLVIAPYATVLAAMIAPREACKNLKRLAADGREGAYGFYEAVDYTPSRMPPGQTSVSIQSFMAHHQGLSLLALVSVLDDRPMQRRFLASPVLRAAHLLLQERIPKVGAGVFPEDAPVETRQSPAREGEGAMRIYTTPASRLPEVHLLSNGRYHVAVSNAGGGYSRWRDLAVTRWREDGTRDCWGNFVYLRDMATGEFWSAAYQPTLRQKEGYEAIFTQARAEFRQRHAGLELHTEISVSPEDDVELRRVRLINHSPLTRVIELTTYAEVVLATPGADEAHTAFSNLFVQTEFLREASAILCTRRARSPDEQPPWLLHMLVAQGGGDGDVSCETDRSRFIGRGGSPAEPAALQAQVPLSNTAGSVLDPIVALRRTVTVKPHETVIVTLILGMCETRAAAVALTDKYQSPRMADRAFDLAWTHSQVTLRHLNATEAEAQLYGRLASALIYADPSHRASPGVLLNNRRGQSGLWSYGISGDAPIVVVLSSDPDKIEFVRQMIQAHAFWRMKGLIVELVILDENTAIYRQSLHDQITGLISSGIGAPMLDKPGGIFVRRLEQVPHDDRVLLQAAARLVLDDAKGTLAAQSDELGGVEPQVAALRSLRSPSPEADPPLIGRELIFRNGLGGFTRDGHEYVITLEPGQMTPAPWVNVLANPNFGTVVSESGAAYTWAENAHEFRVTPWHNDAVEDPPAEACYLRDEETGEFWSPTPRPAAGETPYVIRHGFGYTVFEHREHGIISELWVYVAVDAPVKFTVLKLRNVSGRPRRLSVTGYWEWVLGDLRRKGLLHVQTEVDAKTGALLARNHYNTEFPGRIVFVDTNDPARTLTADRREFLGRNGTFARPAALKRVRLSGKVGAGLDPCGALQVTFDLAAGQNREVSFRLGVGRSLGEVQGLVARFRRADANRTALEGVWNYWNRTLGAVNVDTPDPAVNVMANGWLLYQTLSCRLWGRTGFYQSGGAYGFRDQLQDVMALVHAEPALTREHLLRAAAHQFREGDVQHWWHPPQGRGVRTHFSDDFLWLPFVTCRYVQALADTGVLDEKVPFLEGRPVKPDEEAYYDLPVASAESATLYAHCVRAIERGLKFGAHGLPLIGCGDWNDGMNLVGRDGRGESVWLAFFLYDVLIQFAGLARARRDTAFADRCAEQARVLQQAVERNAWDGEWYRRAYFDNGEPLGSSANPECQIDSLPQSWSVISGAGDPARSRQAMEAVEKRLVRRGEGLIQLFDPPFDKSALNPGYIKGYIPGVRENGGQYTHGAIWTTMAFALLGDAERAWELFALLNPVNHGKTAQAIATYKVEPYVVAADVYAVAPHIGRGGWTWYTGSAGWMYRLLVETLLGANLEGNQLRLAPRMPAAWPSYKIHYRYRQTVYHITILRAATNGLTLDGNEIGGALLPLVDDRQEHLVELRVP